LVKGRDDRPSILVDDDDAAFRGRLARAFAERGYDTRTACNAGEAMASARADSPELAVVDLRMPGGDGLQLVRELLALDPATKIVLLTGYASIATAVEAIRLGAVHYLPKPADADEIVAAFERAEQEPFKKRRIDFEPATLARAEWEYIQRALGDCGGNISLAAKQLGLHRRSLQRKLKKAPPDR
jgi:two-component system response regulator RegA